MSRSPERSEGDEESPSICHCEERRDEAICLASNVILNSYSVILSASEESPPICHCEEHRDEAIWEWNWRFKDSPHRPWIPHPRLGKVQSSPPI